MALVSIGAVTISHGDPEFSWDSTPTSHGIRGGSISGSCSWTAVQTLSELIANPDTQTTIGGRTGVLEYLVFDDTKLGTFTGYYLLEQFTVSPDHRSSLTTTDVPFSITCAFLGDVA